MEGLIVRPRDKEGNCVSNKKIVGNSMVAKTHIVEDGPKNTKTKHYGQSSSKESQRSSQASASNATRVAIMLRNATSEKTEATRRKKSLKPT